MVGKAGSGRHKLRSYEPRTSDEALIGVLRVERLPACSERSSQIVRAVNAEALMSQCYASCCTAIR